MKNNQSMVISVGSDGTVQGLYSDSMPLKGLGRQQVVRATDIAHNNETQKFDVYLLPERYLCAAAVGFEEYEHARMYEVTLLNICRVLEVPPESSVGVLAANIARKHTDAITKGQEALLDIKETLLTELNKLKGGVPWTNLIGLKA